MLDGDNKIFAALVIKIICHSFGVKVSQIVIQNNAE